MNGPLFAAIIVVATVAFTFWFAWYGIYEPPPLIVLASLFAWALPLFYAGGWALGLTLGETTSGLLLTILVGFLGWLRIYFESALFDASLPTQERDGNKELGN
jgi:hypothetical protein